MDSKKLREISKQLKSSSRIHKAQADKIDKILKSMNSKRK